MKKVEIEIPDNKKVEWVNGVLTLVDVKDITERVKTFVDAKDILGSTHQYVYEWLSTSDLISQVSPDLNAFLNLRVICKALNEGWEPKFTKDESRYVPCFYLYTKEDIEKSPSFDMKHFYSLSNYDTDYAGIICNGAREYFADEISSGSPCLCLKSEELAIYCGTQFIHIWANYLLKKKWYLQK